MKENERGEFLIFEGVGKSGKTTQQELATNYLNIRGIKTISTREPGGLEPAEQIRKLIFELRRKNLVNADHQMAPFFAARHLWVKNIVAPAIDSGLGVNSDRSYPATGAYQGYAEGGDLKKIEEIAKVIMGRYMPDGIILVDISPETAMSRKNSDDDPFDNQDIHYFRRVIEGYREMAKVNWSGVRWYVISGEPPIETVFENVKDVLAEIFKKKPSR
jgi:dTMP kinase